MLGHKILFDYAMLAVGRLPNACAASDHQKRPVLPAPRPAGGRKGRDSG